MNVRRFFAPTARDALRRLKEELGGDAIVLSNRSVDGGVEILAIPPSALAQVIPAARPGREALLPPPAAPAAEADDDYTVSLSASLRGGEAKPWRPFQAPRVETPAVKETPAPQPRPAGKAQRAADPRPAAAASAVPAAPRTAAPAIGAEAPAANAQVLHELGAIRSLIERQLAGFAWGDLKRESAVKSRLLGELLELGFSAAMARRLVDNVPADSDEAAGRAAVRALVNRDLLTLDNDADIIDRGGVYALVGPTGVGKTTTTAKLAARCVVRHGADRVALLTTDGYRIGAHEQLRIYGRILGVIVHAVRDAADLRQTLSELRNKHMVLIDTMGMGQRDRQVAEQTAMLLKGGSVRRLLLLNATSRGDTLDDVVRAYGGKDLVGAIVTKVDEAMSLAPVLDVLMRRELGLFYVANGQRVPEDLHLPNRTYLLHRALKAGAEDSPFRYAGDEAGLLLAAGQAGDALYGVERA